MGWFGRSKSKTSSGAAAADVLKRGIAAYSAGNFDEAVALLEPLAAQCDPTAQVVLGDMYAHGQGVQQDARRALQYYQLAAQTNFPLAQVRLGLMYAEGFGVLMDYRRALEFYTKAADQGFPLALHYLGLSHEKGRGVAADASRAAKFYRLAAEKDVASAQCNLGALYARGEGVSQNVVLAYFLFRLAARGGNELGLRNLGASSAQMTLIQIDEGDSLFKSWRPGRELPSRTQAVGTLQAPSDELMLSKFRPLLSTARELSLGDLSTLEAILTATAGELMTMAGSSNEKLWNGFVRLGWAVSIKPPDELANTNTTLFRITDAGRQQIAILWRGIVAERTPPTFSTE